MKKKKNYRALCCPRNYCRRKRLSDFLFGFTKPYQKDYILPCKMRKVKSSFSSLERPQRVNECAEVCNSLCEGLEEYIHETIFLIYSSAIFRKSKPK